jgi:hypothetical protein
VTLTAIRRVITFVACVTLMAPSDQPPVAVTRVTTGASVAVAASAGTTTARSAVTHRWGRIRDWDRGHRWWFRDGCRVALDECGLDDIRHAESI